MPLGMPRPITYSIRFIVWVGASITFTTKLRETVWPAASDAEHVTSVAPIGSLLPSSGTQLCEVTPTLSCAVNA